MAMPDAEANSTSGSTIVAEGVSFTYPAGRRANPDPAVRDVSFRIEPGETASLLGPNGGGKSTLFKMLCGLLSPDQGRIQLGGEPGAIDLESLGIVFQSPVLDPHLTVRENLESHATLRGLARREMGRAIDAGLESAGLADLAQRRTKRLSGGQRRRVDLLRALLHRPSVLILDEPTIGLDPSAREDFLDRVESLHTESGMTIVLSTHLIDEAERFERLLIMDRGQLIADSTPGRLRSELGKQLLTVLDREWTPPEGERERWTRTSRGWVHADEADANALADRTADLVRRGVTCSVAPPTLADVFEHRTGRALADAERSGAARGRSAGEAAA